MPVIPWLGESQLLTPLGLGIHMIYIHTQETLMHIILKQNQDQIPENQHFSECLPFSMLGWNWLSGCSAKCCLLSYIPSPLSAVFQEESTSKKRESWGHEPKQAFLMSV